VTAPDPQWLYVYDMREPVWLSAARDVVSFVGLIGTAVALNTLMPPSAWLNAFLGLTWFLWLAGKPYLRAKRKTPSEAIAWVREQYPDAVQS
jgi:hypothetical protein